MSQSIPDVVDSKGRAVPLGALLGRGAEGSVYEVRGADTAAKIYHTDQQRSERAPKVAAMVRLFPNGLSPVIAWPLDALSLRRTKEPVGLLIPKVRDHKNVHHAYGPKSRLKDFPRADWRFLVRTAANIARAFAAVHDARCVIGDVNHGSILVAQDATVKLIDCDSFQVETPGRKFLCEVGIETFTPPELQGKPFRGVVRTANYDNFGLAVMTFLLLFMGRHPFAGRYLGPGGVMPIRQAIEEFRFPYGANHRSMQMEPPPGTPPLSFAGPEVAALFEKAFSRAGMLQGRPTARDWAAALTALEKKTRQCSASKSHWYPSHESACPWCRMEALGAKPLFPFTLPSGIGSLGAGIDLEALARALQAIGDPGPAPSFTAPDVQPSQEAVVIGKPGNASSVVGAIVGVAIVVGGMQLKPGLLLLYLVAAVAGFIVTKKLMSKEHQIASLKERLAQAEAAARGAETDWNRRAGAASFYEARTAFLKYKAELEAIPQKRLKALDALRAQQRRHQLEQFLENYELEDAQINGIGAGRKRVLESYGIEAADDVSVRRLQAVPGFGPKLIGNLMAWRKSCEAGFRFDPSKPLDPREVTRVEQEMLTLRNQLQTAVRTAHARAIETHAEVLRTRQSMRAPLEQLLREHAQARADYNFVRGV